MIFCCSLNFKTLKRKLFDHVETTEHRAIKRLLENAKSGNDSYFQHLHWQEWWNTYVHAEGDYLEEQECSIYVRAVS
jgi:hypothetical protein